jgi:hypothetical protein
MIKEPKFLEVKEVDGYFALRRVYVPKKYNNTVLRKPYDSVVEQHVEELLNRVNRIQSPSERKTKLMTQLEEILG